MGRVTEGGRAETLDLVHDIAGLAFVALDTVFLGSDTERFDAGMAGAAGFRLFHVGHRIAFTVFQTENGVMAHSAVIIILGQMDGMAEDDRFGALELVGDVFGFDGTGTDCRQQQKHKRKQGT